MIKVLILSEHAYVVNGSVYFDISTFKKYGKLSHNTVEQLKAGAGGRVETNSDKRNQLDFALWIADPDHVMKWKSPWGIGYPGWHIECSVMVKKYLGNTIDIHTGGEDNMFPHHECEIAQSEAATGKTFANYWMHTKHLLVDGEKMSKSKGNFYTLRDLIKKGYDAKEFRYLLIASHYRDNMNFTFNSLDAAKKTVASLIDFVDKIKEMKTKAKGDKKLHELTVKSKSSFENYMNDDLNTPQALAVMHELVRATNKAIEDKTASEENLKEVYETMMNFDKVLGIIAHEKAEVPTEIHELIERRQAARKKKDFEAADAIRKEISEKGWIVEDTPKGPRCRKA